MWLYKEFIDFIVTKAFKIYEEDKYFSGSC